VAGAVKEAYARQAQEHMQAVLSVKSFIRSLKSVKRALAYVKRGLQKRSMREWQAQAHTQATSSKVL